MSSFSIKDISNDRMKININLEDGVSIVFSGEIDMEDPGILLDPFFIDVHNELVKLGIENIIADFSQLKFLNSSGIKSIAKWILMQVVEKNPLYIIHIKHNPNITWQITSLPTLTFLVPGAVKII